MTHRSQKQTTEGAESSRPDYQKISSPAGLDEGNRRWVFTGLAPDDDLRRHSGDVRQGTVYNLPGGFRYTDGSHEDVTGSPREDPRSHHVELSTGSEGLAGGPVERQIRFIGAVHTNDDVVGISTGLVGLGFVGRTNDRLKGVMRESVLDRPVNDLASTYSKSVNGRGAVIQ